MLLHCNARQGGGCAAHLPTCLFTAGTSTRSTHAVTAAATSCETASSLPESGKGCAFFPPAHHDRQSVRASISQQARQAGSATLRCNSRPTGAGQRTWQGRALMVQHLALGQRVGVVHLPQRLLVLRRLVGPKGLRLQHGCMQHIALSGGAAVYHTNALQRLLAECQYFMVLCTVVRGQAGA